MKLFVFLIIVVCAFGSNLQAQTNLFDVTAYDAVIAPDLNNKSVTGKVLVRFNSLRENLNEITLNAGNLEIDSVREKLEKLEFEKTESLLRIHFTKPLKNGETREIEIVYHGVPKYGINFFPEQNQVGIEGGPAF